MKSHCSNSNSQFHCDRSGDNYYIVDNGGKTHRTRKTVGRWARAVGEGGAGGRGVGFV